VSAPILSEFKRGDTFMLTCTHKVAGVATSVTGYTIASQIRNRYGRLVATLEAELANQGTSPGVFYLTPTDPDTTGWEIGRHDCDIELYDGGVIRSTQTFVVPVAEDVTTGEPT